MLLKNTAGGVYLTAFNSGTGLVATGVGTTITGSYSLDGSATVAGFTTANPTDRGGGVYWQPLVAAETNGDVAAYMWSSSTAGIVINPVVQNTTGVSFPTAAPNAAGGLITLGTGAGQLTTDGAGHPVLAAAQTFSTTGSVGSVVGNVGGNVVGSTASVTGAVGSVTGAVGSVTAGVTVATNADKTGYALATPPPTAAAIAAANWSDAGVASGAGVVSASMGATAAQLTFGTVSGVPTTTSIPITAAASATLQTGANAYVGQWFKIGPAGESIDVSPTGSTTVGSVVTLTFLVPLAFAPTAGWTVQSL